MEATIAQIEENIRTLEAWADTCKDGASLPLRNIIIIKINSLSNRLERVRLLIDKCPHCGKPKAYTATFGSICISCNFSTE